MANYYLVGGGTGGTVNMGDPTYWSLTSGGAGGAGVPGAFDDTFINAGSGTNIIVIGSLSAKSLTCAVTASNTHRFDGVSIFLYGNLTFSTSTLFSTSLACSINVYSPAAGTASVNMAGVNFNNIGSVALNSSAQPIALSGAILNPSTVLITATGTGVVNTAGFAITTGSFSIDGYSTSVINQITLGASTITAPYIYINGSASLATAVNFNSATLISTATASGDAVVTLIDLFTASTSTVRCTGVSPFISELRFYTLGAAATSPLNAVQLQGDVNTLRSSNASAVTIASLTKTTNANNLGRVNVFGNFVVSGTATFTGNSAINRVAVVSGTFGSAQSITAATTSITNADFRDITALGTAAWSGTSVGDWQGNTGITFTAATTRYAVAAGNWSSTAVWSATNGGASGASVPLAQDNVIINNLSGSGVITSTVTRALGKDISIQSGYAGSVSFDNLLSGSEDINGIYGNITIANEINVATTAVSSVTYATRSAFNISYGNKTSLYALIIGPTDINLLSDVGSALYTGNIFDSSLNPGFLGTFYSNNFTIYSTQLILNSYTTVSLGSSSIFSYGRCSFPSMTTNTSTVYIMDTAVLGGSVLTGNNFNNIVVAKTSGNPTISLIGTVNVNGTFTDNNPTYPASTNYTLSGGSLVFEGSGTLNIANSNVYVKVNNVMFFNNTSKPLQTKKAAYTGCSGTGSFSGTDLIAYGLADLGGNTGILFPSIIKTLAFTGSTAQSFTLPSSFGGAALVRAIGGGGDAVTQSGGGGGGAYASGLFQGTYAKGQTLYVSTTTNSPLTAQDAWLNTSNTAPVSNTVGVLAKAGSTGTTRTGGSSASCVGNLNNYTGGTGGSASGNVAGAGGGSAARTNGTGYPAGNGGDSRTVNNGGSGGAGISGASGAVISQNGTAGGNPSGGTAGVGGASNTAGGNATAGLGGGGGGAGGGYSTTTSTKAGTYSRASASTALVMDITNHQMTYGSTYSFFFSPFNTGTYSKPSTSSASSTTITVSSGHGLSNGQIVYIDFTTGNLLSRDGYYTITYISATQFSVIASPGYTGTASGNISLYPALTGTSFSVTVINSNQISVTTTSTCVMPSTVTSSNVTVVNYDNPGLSGGNGATSSSITYDYLNGALASGSIGPGGGGGGGSASNGFAGGNGGAGGIGAGGGSGGSGTSLGTAGIGGNGLVLFTYAVSAPSPQGFIIG